MNLDEHLHVNQSILPSANCYCIFHISCFMYCTFHWVLSHCNFLLSHQYLRCLCYWSHWKANDVNQIIWLFLTKDLPSISQSNVQAVKAENEEQYTLSNMTYIKFPNCCFFFFKVYFEAPKMYTNQLNNICNGVDFFVCRLTKICFSTRTFQDFWSDLFCSYL